MLQVSLNISFQPLIELSPDQLPIAISNQGDSDRSEPKLQCLTDLISNFNKKSNELLAEIFSDLCANQKFSFNVVATSGVPAPYDAWTVSYGGKPTIFFNLSEWTDSDLQKSGLAVILHEVTHALLDEVLPKMDSKDPIEALKRVVINEGIAHFIGFPGNREEILGKYSDKWEPAEQKLEEAFRRLSAADLSLAKKGGILTESNTGAFWEKFGAIAGMFRAADVYSKSGAQGLIEAIQIGQLVSER